MENENENETSEISLCKKDLEAWQGKQIDMNIYVETLASKKHLLMENFNRENKELIEKIEKLSNELSIEKTTFKNLAIEEFKKTGEKKLVGGLGIRVGTSLVYDETKAFEWATEHSLCLQLNKKAFEKMSKIQSIPFVTKEEKVTATFPAKIKLEEE